MDREVVKEEKRIEDKVENLISENRVVSFSDAVFAFAATLLVLKIELPQMDSATISNNLLPSLINLSPQYFANIISFMVIGYYWLNHHAIFGMIKRFDKTIVWLNLIFLISISFLPFPVDLFGDYPGVASVLIFYSASIAFVGFLLSLIWFYAFYKGLVGKDVSKKSIRYYTLRQLIAPVVYLISIPLVIIDPFIGQFSWILVILGILFLNSFFKFKKLSEIERDTV